MANCSPDKMYIAVEGCCHGELDKIYETLQYIENKEKIKISLLLCCGDFEAIRNEADLQCMAVPDKYKTMQDFWQYYSGKKTAPYLTIFIGGNHEASNYLQELPYGGWVAPNIYYMGYAGVVNYKGLRIGGISGIFKQHDYSKGHYEKPPYCQQTKRSVYHVRHMEVFRLKQLKQPLDIMMSHDWPNGIVNHGNKEELLYRKPHFQADVRNNQLGSLPSWDLLKTLRPKYWFSGHLHIKFAAMIEHQLNAESDCINKNTVTRFLALDKCLPRRDFLQVLNVDCLENSPGELVYDAEWLAILKQTNGLMSTSPKSFILPTEGLHDKWDYSVSAEEIEEVMKIMENELQIPLNFQQDESCLYNPEQFCQNRRVECKINQQTTEFCAKIVINDPLMMLMHSNEEDARFNTSSWLSEEGEEMPSAIISNVSINPEEIDLDDDDDDEVEETTSDELPKDAVVADTEESTSCMSSAEETDSEKNIKEFKTPIHLAAKSSMNLPSPVSASWSSELSSKSDGDQTQSESQDAPFSPITSSSDSESVNREQGKLCGKRQSDTDSDASERAMASANAGKKFKRRNASFYVSQSEDDTS